MRVPILAIALLLAAAGSSLAADGRVEINQARALAGGITLGDDPGFPITLFESGSYVLTSDLEVPGGLDGIITAVRNVGLDLNGFTISGPVTCTGTGAALLCSGGPAGIGIRLNVGGSIVRNGVVRGFSNGILTTPGVLLRDLSVSRNLANGIAVAIGPALIANSHIENNGGGGINAADSTLVAGTAANGNFSNGLNLGIGDGGVLAARATAHGNGQTGVVIFREGLATEVATRNNGTLGALLGSCGLAIETAHRANSLFQSQIDATAGAASSAFTSAGAGAPISAAGTMKLDDNLCNGAPCP